MTADPFRCTDDGRTTPHTRRVRTRRGVVTESLPAAPVRCGGSHVTLPRPMRRRPPPPVSGRAVLVHGPSRLSTPTPPASRPPPAGRGGLIRRPADRGFTPRKKCDRVAPP